MSLTSEVSNQTIEYYDRIAEQFFRETVAVDMSGIYAPFIELIPAGGKILDAGCGSGRDSLYFSQKDFEVTAFDASMEMVRKARELTGLDVWQMSFDEIDWTTEFDGIWACASLLHLPKNEIENTLARLLKTLKSGGILYASFKEGIGEGTENGRFFSYYNKRELQNTLKNLGSNHIEKCWISSDVRRAKQKQNWINLLTKRI